MKKLTKKEITKRLQPLIEFAKTLGLTATIVFPDNNTNNKRRKRNGKTA